MDMALALALAAKAGGSGGGGGSGSGLLIIHEILSDDARSLDKTWQEIHDADLPVIITDTEYMSGTMRKWDTFISTVDTSYEVVNGDGEVFEAGSASGYPSISR